MLTKKIKVTYFIDKVSTFFDLYRYESEGYNILLLEGNYPEDDILTKDIISSIKNIEYQEKGNLRPIIREVINKYIDTKELPRPQKDFFYKYLNAFAKKNKWIKLKSNNTFLGLITNYNIEIEPDKKLEILKSYSDFNIIKNRLRKQNLPFRKFILDLEEEIKSDFSSRYPRS